ncbi:hypothetical protein [Atopomonas sediminilitoris]|uniref:hypothetical protein n=1 Tax=Atopomonas sediminilitoris TaxID=2919919 RepID=UPI001F4D66A5|nr:hypothetical protein [Atopomonas sediminilitoris]MCJ8170456.1 hypothetical protein [Atopomonas sediminilitoris]
MGLCWGVGREALAVCYRRARNLIYLFSWRISVVIFLPALLLGCAVQGKPVFTAIFANACIFPVRIAVKDYSNAKGHELDVAYVEPGGVIEVFSHVALINDLPSSVPDSYQLTLFAQEKQRTLDKAQFLAQLKQSPYQRQGNGVHTWTIRDASLCP